MRHHARVGHLLLAAALLGPTVRPSGPWFTPDRVKHFFLSFFVQSASYSLARGVGLGREAALVPATAATATVGLSKEIWDRRRGTGFDRRDLVWDALGAGAASALLLRTVK
jgi:uncharacterized protein YfiM (DUF2279 family)